MALADKLLASERRLCRELATLRFAAPVTHVYNPLVHARRPHALYTRRYATKPIAVLYLGMNPGPWGMVQTGVPFGEVRMVRDWLGIDAAVEAPEQPHPKRPVEGFACTRSEVSGARLWGAVAEHYREPSRFFARAWVANYCPLTFMERSGRNRTPDKLPRDEREALFAACDRNLQRTVALLSPRWVVGIGKFAADRARAALEDGLPVHSVLHPSPASPLANQGWAPRARRELRAAGICREGARASKAHR